jgi:hypothetical protein
MREIVSQRQRGASQTWLRRWTMGYRAFRLHGIPLGLALALGGMLRLIWPNDTEFLSDQAQTLIIAQSGVAHHALIAAGTIISIGALSLPMPVWLYASFSLIGSPLAATVFTALCNTVAIGLLYGLVTRFGGRSAGFVSALLYATASTLVRFSRFMWQPNLMAPFLLALLGAVLWGVVERRKGWLGWAILFWGVCVQLHTTAAPLIGVIGFGLLFTWRELRWRDLVWSGVALAALFGPTLLWEIASSGFDLRAYRSLSSLPAIMNAAGPLQYATLLAPAPPDLYGAGSSYVVVGMALGWLGPVMSILAFIAGIWLTAIAIAPWLSGRRMAGGAQAMLATPRWRVAATLWLWQMIPMLTLLRHTVGVQTHYLLALAPIIYLSIGLWAAAASRASQSYLARRWPRVAWAAPAGLALLTLALTSAQALGVAAELSAVHAGRFSGVTDLQNYGIPLGGAQATLIAAERSAATDHATLAVASTALEQDAYAYLAQAGSNSATVYFSDGCVITPSLASGRPLVTLALPGTLALAKLPTLDGAQRLETLHAQGSSALALYLTRPGASPQDEIPLPTVPNGTGLRPIAYSYATTTSGQNYLTLRWSSAPTLTQSPGARPIYWFGSTANGPLVANYTITAQQFNAAGQPVGAPLTAQCDRLAWQPGIDLLAWLPLAATERNANATWRVSLSAALAYATRPTIGPITLETGDVSFALPRTIAGPLIIHTR